MRAPGATGAADGSEPTGNSRFASIPAGFSGVTLCWNPDKRSGLRTDWIGESKVLKAVITRLLVAVVALVSTSLLAHAQGYRLKSGDKIEVVVWQEPKLNRVLTVGPDGRISMPLVGRVKAGGATVEQVETQIKSRLAKQYTSDIDVNVSLAEVKEYPPEPPLPPEEKIFPPVFVTGEVAKPGRYEMKEPTDILQAIAMAGGLTPFAAERRIVVRRKASNGHEDLYEFNYRAYTEGRDESGNFRLRPGDVVVVPERGLFE